MRLAFSHIFRNVIWKINEKILSLLRNNHATHNLFWNREWNFEKSHRNEKRCCDSYKCNYSAHTKIIIMSKKKCSIPHKKARGRQRSLCVPLISPKKEAIQLLFLPFFPFRYQPTTFSWWIKNMLRRKIWQHSNLLLMVL